MSRSTLADFEKLGVLGKGSFGIVHRVRRKVDGKVYVLKQINISSLNRKEQQDAINEVQILASIESPHVVRYYDSFLEANSLNIIMEFCQHGDMHQKLKKQRGRLLSEDEIWRYFIQAVLGVHVLHSKKILHRDLKTMNLFLDASDNVKLGDLGVAKVLGSKKFAHTIVGTPYYLSPELCEDKPYNELSDVWALGCVLYEMCTLKHPFDARNQGALILKIIQGRYPPLRKGQYSSRLRRLLDRCLQKSTSSRPSVFAILTSSGLVAKARELGLFLDFPADIQAAVAKKERVTADSSAAHVGVGGDAKTGADVSAPPATDSSSSSSSSSSTAVVEQKALPSGGGKAGMEHAARRAKEPKPNARADVQRAARPRKGGPVQGASRHSAYAIYAAALPSQHGRQPVGAVGAGRAVGGRNGSRLRRGQRAVNGQAIVGAAGKARAGRVPRASKVAPAARKARPVAARRSASSAGYAAATKASVAKVKGSRGSRARVGRRTGAPSPSSASPYSAGGRKPTAGRRPRIPHSRSTPAHLHNPNTGRRANGRGHRTRSPVNPNSAQSSGSRARSDRVEVHSSTFLDDLPAYEHTQVWSANNSNGDEQPAAVQQSVVGAKLDSNVVNSASSPALLSSEQPEPAVNWRVYDEDSLEVGGNPLELSLVVEEDVEETADADADADAAGVALRADEMPGASDEEDVTASDNSSAPPSNGTPQHDLAPADVDEDPADASGNESFPVHSVRRRPQSGAGTPPLQATADEQTVDEQADDEDHDLVAMQLYSQRRNLGLESSSSAHSDLSASSGADTDEDFEDVDEKRQSAIAKLEFRFNRLSGSIAQSKKALVGSLGEESFQEHHAYFSARSVETSAAGLEQPQLQKLQVSDVLMSKFYKLLYLESQLVKVQDELERLNSFHA